MTLSTTSIIIIRPRDLTSLYKNWNCIECLDWMNGGLIAIDNKNRYRYRCLEICRGFGRTFPPIVRLVSQKLWSPITLLNLIPLYKLVHRIRPGWNISFYSDCQKNLQVSEGYFWRSTSLYKDISGPGTITFQRKWRLSYLLYQIHSIPYIDWNRSIRIQETPD